MMTASLNHRKKMKAVPRQEIPQTAGCKARARFVGTAGLYLLQAGTTIKGANVLIFWEKNLLPYRKYQTLCTKFRGTICKV